MSSPPSGLPSLCLVENFAALRYSVTTTATLSGQTSKATAGYLVVHNVQISGPKSTMYSAGRPFAECCMREPQLITVSRCHFASFQVENCGDDCLSACSDDQFQPKLINVSIDCLFSSKRSLLENIARLHGIREMVCLHSLMFPSALSDA
ncbi:hypothetical protein T10_11002 [Trichinella papuae]|uniref:Uncharacterized protein n=1 Tax=Trichinella papuae TaxID=268474 RepID=A0A0V1MAU7_9BILA|nr:hypothetical protein T10_11002 [Trichinella papuae]